MVTTRQSPTFDGASPTPRSRYDGSLSRRSRRSSSTPDHLFRRRRHAHYHSPTSRSSHDRRLSRQSEKSSPRHHSRHHSLTRWRNHGVSSSRRSLKEEIVDVKKSNGRRPHLSEQREAKRLKLVERKDLEGIERHTDVFSLPEKKIADIQEKKRKGSSDRKKDMVIGKRSVASSVSPIRPNPASDLMIQRKRHYARNHLPLTPWNSDKNSISRRSLKEEGADGKASNGSLPLSKDQREAIQFKSVRRKYFEHFERIDKSLINVLEGLELHTNVFSAEEQKKIVDCVYDLQKKGRRGQLKERTYMDPRRGKSSKGRVRIQFGCCYNYTLDKYGNRPGIMRDEQVDPLPPFLKSMIKRMIACHVLPRTCIPDSCIINIYEKGDFIPPHIDHHDFIRPFCTASFLSECKITFGTVIKPARAGKFSGPVAIPLPLGSVLILSGNGADLAKHCVSAVPTKRISITFRKMDSNRLPFRFRTDPELQNLPVL